MQDQNCVFCKIAREEIPTTFVYENEFVVAFRDINPIAPGHTLVVPREHYRWFYEVPGEISNEWFAAAQEIAAILRSEQSAGYIEMSIIGIDMPHAHIHLIPRKNA